MFAAQVTVEGNLASDPQLRYTPAGTALAEAVVLVKTGRRVNDEYHEDEPTRVRVIAWERLAENLASSAGTGDRLIIVGRLHTEAHADRTTGEKRTTQKLTADAIGFSFRFHAVTAQKNQPTRRYDDQAQHVDIAATASTACTRPGKKHEKCPRGPSGNSHSKDPRSVIGLEEGRKNNRSAFGAQPAAPGSLPSRPSKSAGALPPRKIVRPRSASSAAGAPSCALVAYTPADSSVPGRQGKRLANRNRVVEGCRQVEEGDGDGEKERQEKRSRGNRLGVPEAQGEGRQQVLAVQGSGRTVRDRGRADPGTAGVAKDAEERLTMGRELPLEDLDLEQILRHLRLAEEALDAATLDHPDYVAAFERTERLAGLLSAVREEIKR